MAQQVDLRSPDEFISVEGEIVGFNGVMLRVQTSVGAISVPASEVICYGAGCIEVLASNDFGLTAGAMIDVVVDGSAPASSGDQTLSVGFESATAGGLYRTVAGAFAVASDTSATVVVSADGAAVLSNDEASLKLNIVDDGGDADIVVETVSLNGTAAQQYSGPGDWITTTQPGDQLLGLNAFSVIVAPNAGISEISLNDLARVFAGEVTNWSQIGGADVSVLPLQLPTNSDLWAQMNKLVMEPAGKTVAGNVLTMSDQAGISASILQFPGSISIIDFAVANADQTIAVAGACGIAVMPNAFNIISGDYPLARPIMASYNTAPTAPFAAELFDFASTDVAQGLLDREGFLNHSAQQQDPVLKNERLGGLLNASLDDAQRAAAAEMFQVLFDANRLSTTMTGGAASGPEGAWNRAMMIDLAGLVSGPEYQGREIVFAGFGASTSGSDAAISASLGAAQSMQAAFEQFAGAALASNEVTVSPYGFGNVFPATCVDGQVAGSGYTRVEVWVR
ncbi:PstS family phosphate ABC transporter substrate-binding protein [Loktanella sp. Alg231-35]|uniref:PstS family phosphate ABC transporter substrate-binding protein n=1 Tax=Loktanella sp. Alg231-35 TaxID=1922220 RepID=UPI00131F0F94|nr:substrate-binding domain-containing protein [Loktanella sp. Alg231-35]